MTPTHRFRIMRSNRHAANRRRYQDELSDWTPPAGGETAPMPALTRAATRKAQADRQLRDRMVEATGAAFGLLGAFMLALKGDMAGWGFVALLASNIGWLAFGWIRRHWLFFGQQVGFTVSSLLGIWRWLLT